MLVVADSGPIRYLVQLDLINLLLDQFKTITIPKSVILEISNPATPERVRRFAENLPAWVNVVENVNVLKDCNHLDVGERDAMSIAAEHPNRLVLTDDRDARNYAVKRNIRVTGTLGILRDAAIKGAIDIRVVMNRLQVETNFRASEELVALIVELVEKGRIKQD